MLSDFSIILSIERDVLLGIDHHAPQYWLAVVRFAPSYALRPTPLCVGPSPLCLDDFGYDVH